MRRAIGMGAVMAVAVLLAGCGAARRPPRLVAPTPDASEVRAAVVECMVSREVMAETLGDTTVLTFRTRTGAIENCVQDGSGVSSGDGPYESEAIVGMPLPELITLASAAVTDRVRIGVVRAPEALKLIALEGTVGRSVTGLGFTHGGRTIAVAQIKRGRFLAALRTNSTVTGAIVERGTAVSRIPLPRQVSAELTPHRGFFDNFIGKPGPISGP